MSVIKGLFSGTKDGSKAAGAQQGYNQQAIDEMRRQFGITQENISPWMDAGRDQLGVLQQGTTATGLDERLAQIFGTNTFSNLVDERTRAVEGQLSAGGLTRSGTALQEASRIPTDIGLMLEQPLTGRSEQMANAGQNAALNLGQFGNQNSSNIGAMLQNTGKAISSGIVTDAQSKAQGKQNLLNTVTSIGSMFFSDSRLKDNVEEVAEIKDLKVYQWDWKESTKGTLIDGCGNMGFMADEVKEKYPQHVYEFGGFMVIDYPELLNELEAA